MRARSTALGLLCLLLLLAGCAAGQPVPPTQVPPPTALPTVTALAAAPTPASSTQFVPSATPTPAPPTAPAQPTPAPAAPATPTPGLDREPYATLGSPDAPITIYEFSDYGCPQCRQFHLLTFPTLRADYIDTGLVYYVSKNYPIVSQQGGLAAQAAECAGEQGAFWAMHARLFQQPQAWDSTRETALQVFAGYAEELELDAPALRACVSEGRYQAEVDRDFEEGMEIGLFGVPVFIINRKLLSGAQPPQVFAEVIERELAAQPTPPARQP